MKYLVLALVGLCACTGNAWAWGSTGHQIVCELAFRLAAPSTRASIRALMKNDKDYDFFSQSCVWPDQSPQVQTRGDEHFVNLPRNAKSLREADLCPVSSPCVMTAIDKDLAVLSSKTATQKQKLEALKYLGHWVGDLHQPLHVSFKDDRGGNSVEVEYVGLQVDDCSPKLHSAWDSCLVFELLGADVDEAASTLMKGITTATIERWTEGKTPIDWANESFRISIDPKTKYCNREGQSCARIAGVVVVDADYVAANGPIVKERLQKAAARLAKLLDEALGD